jgi:Ser/Thr protein kinase RdoA (MazF antagonist)
MLLASVQATASARRHEERDDPMHQDDFDKLSPRARLDNLQQLARVALGRWHLDAAPISLLKYRENAVFKVTEPGSGERFVLRVHRPAYRSDAELRSELQWTAALIEAGIDAPAAVPTVAGELFVTVSHDAVPEARQCDLLRWVDGTIIGDIEAGQIASAAEVHGSHFLAGRLAARIHNHGEHWSRPPGFARPIMDFDGLIGSRAYLGPYSACTLLSREDVTLLDRARNAIRVALDEFGQSPDRYGLTHGDFLPENLLRDGDTVRIIDFDDCGFGWHVMDVATSLLFLLGEPQYEDALTGFVGGYRTARALPDEHLQLLPVFLLARAMTYVGWCGSRPEAPIAQEKGPIVVGATLALAREFLGQLP